ncbi:cytochrome P450 [Aspergillus karnatakaensis]|uniref:cytochrome P450 n=1 Tax=Aspergillus karnatakaensis TaxID=1810916 RepID=UPI003CCD3C8F
MLLTWVVAISAIAWLLARFTPRAKHDKRILPGPPGKPLVGNLLDIPPHHSWLKFKDWADEYGPIFRLNLGGRQHVVLSTEKAANDLLRERGTYYSSREYLPMASGILSRELRPLLLPYNDRWRRGRRLMHQLTMPVAADSYQPVQDYESKKLLVSLLQDPAGYEKWFEQYASGVILRVGFGKWLESADQIERIIRVNHNLERVASPGAYLVDSFPILAHLPEFLAPFKREGRRLHEEELGLFRELQADVRNELQRGTKAYLKSFTRTFLENQEIYRLSDDEGAYVIGTLFEAGSGTTAAAMMSFCLAMCHFPDWQKKMQDELDIHVGSRMPEFTDIPNLPTVRAVIKEVLRWRPVTAGGFPHQLTTDDEYEGYFFKNGTIFHPNQWAIHRDPGLYPDAENFRPERWLEPQFPTYHEPLSKYPNLQNFSCFGFGRRICPGQNIAERSLHILTARIAWAGNIMRKRNADGKQFPPPPLYSYTKGFNTQPEHFEFDFAARSPERYDAVFEALRQARATRPA